MQNCDTRNCITCGLAFEKFGRESRKQWEKRKYCSQTCSNRSTAKCKMIPLAEKFAAYVVKGKDPDACWGWKGASDQYGYGKIGLGTSYKVKIHRYSYEQAFGPVPQRLGVLHKCDNPPCSNPRHLFIGTQQDNCRDMVLKGRQNPISLLNLRPGAKGFHGAGPISKGEKNEWIE